MAMKIWHATDLPSANAAADLQDKWIIRIGVPLTGFLLPNAAGCFKNIAIDSATYWLGLGYSCLIVYGIWASLVQWVLRHHMRIRRVNKPALIWLYFVAGNVLVGALCASLATMAWYVFRGLPIDWLATLRVALLTITAIALLSQLYLGLYARADLYFLFARTLRLRDQEAQDILTTVSNRKDPQIILSALDGLRKMIDQNPAKAVYHAEGLAAVHRYILREGQREGVILRDELSLVQRHAELLGSRYGDTAHVEIAIDRMHLDRYLIVPASLHLLLENVVNFKSRQDGQSPLLTIQLAGTTLHLQQHCPAREMSEMESIRISRLSARCQRVTGFDIRVMRGAEQQDVFVPLLRIHS